MASSKLRGHASSSVRSPASRTICRVLRTANGPLAAIRARVSSGRRRSASGTTRLTSPSWSARCAVDRVAVDRELGGEGQRDAFRQADQGAGGEQAAVHLRNAELGLFGGDDEVARQHDLETTGEREPVDGRDDWLRIVAPHESGEVARPSPSRRPCPTR